MVLSFCSGRALSVSLTRDSKEQARSQGKLLQLAGIQATREQRGGIERSLRRDYGSFRYHLMPHPFLVLQFERILFNPQHQAERIGAFLGEPFAGSDAIARMAAVVEKRGPKCLPDLSYEISMVERDPEVRA